MLADITVLDKNPFAILPEELLRTAALMTIVTVTSHTRSCLATDPFIGCLTMVGLHGPLTQAAARRRRSPGLLPGIA